MAFLLELVDIFIMETQTKEDQMANLVKVNLEVPSEYRLPDNDQWTNRFKIRSASSNRIYIVAQHKTKKHFGCSCPGWIFNKKRICKHIRALGLPGGYTPVQLTSEPQAMLVE